MELDDPLGDDEPERPLLPPDDRLWRHPSEVGKAPGPGHVSLASLVAPARWRVWPVAFLSGAIGALLVVGTVTAVGGFRVREVPVRSVERVAGPAADAFAPAAVMGDRIVTIAEKVRPSVVHVKAQRGDRTVDLSGFLVRSDGHLVTSAPGVQGAQRLAVVTADGATRLARLVGSDPDTAVAVLKIDADRVTPATLGTASVLKVGQLAIVLGMPTTVSVGVVSALGRQVESDDSPLLLDMIQTDAKADASAAGGPLLDASGAVIGLTTMVNGTTYATPIDTARDVVDQLIRTGRVVYPWLGIDGENLDGATARSMGVEGGAIVQQVRPGSPAAVGGIKHQDVITAIGDTPVASMTALKVALRKLRPGESVTLRLRREGKEHTVTVTLVGRPPAV